MDGPLSCPPKYSRFTRSRRQSLPLSAVVLSLLVAVFGALAVFYPNFNGAPCNTSARPSADSFFLPTTVRARGYSASYCSGMNPSNFLRSSDRAWLALLLPATVFCFIGLAIVTDDYFVPALQRICDCLDLSEDVAGATFMAAGSSAPELFTSLLSVLFTEDDVGIGTIVGSAVFNILVIIGLSAALAKETLQLDFRPLLRDSFFYIFSVVALLVMVLFSTRGQADWWEGLILMGGYLVYILFIQFGNKTYFKATEKWVKYGDVTVKSAEVMEAEKMESGMANTKMMEEAQPEKSSLEDKDEVSLKEDVKFFLGVQLPTSRLGWVTLPLFFPWQLLFRWTIVKCDTEKKRNYWPLTFATSIMWIMAISYVMVEAARLSGCFIGIPSSVMGLTVLAAGTSVPDALSSVAVARNGFGDMAVSNAIGSNVFDILIGLGLPWFVGGLVKSKAQAVTVDPIGLVVIPIAILFAIIFVLVGILALLKWKLSRTLGYVLFAMYGAFLTYSLLDVFVFKIGGS